MLTRFDRGSLKRPTRAGRTFVVEGYAARVHKPGDPLRYDWGDEYRDDAELARIVKQLPGLPVTLPHPPGLLKSGAKGRVIGRVDAAWIDGEMAAVRLSITDEQAAREIEDGTKELSLGYETKLDSNSFQRDSESDHLAVVERARCGAKCSLKMDAAPLNSDERFDCSKTCACQIDRPAKGRESGHTMKTLEEAKARIDELEAEKKQLTARITTLEGDIAAGAQAAESDKIKELQTKLDTAEASIKRFDEVRADEARTRAKLEREAEKIMGPQFRMDDLSERAIREAVAKRLDGTLDVKSLNDAELRGHYNALYSLAARNAESQARVGEILGQAREQAPRADEESYESMMRNAWKKNTNSRHGAAGGR